MIDHYQDDMERRSGCYDEETEEEMLERLEREDDERLKQRVRSAMATLCVNTRSLLTERRR